MFLVLLFTLNLQSNPCTPNIVIYTSADKTNNTTRHRFVEKVGFEPTTHSLFRDFQEQLYRLSYFPNCGGGESRTPVLTKYKTLKNN